MQLDHATIVTADLDAAWRFFVDVAGLTEGPRPPVSVDGYWLYADGRAVVHLIRATSTPATSAATPASAAPRIDHVAFRLDSATEWQALLARLGATGVEYQRAQVPPMAPQRAEAQIFVALAPGVVVEFVTALHHAQP
ncbi:VOC family protein [Paraburkholderia sp. MPAMCS5]|uniref:VOC family protein n=1 Tax=Paraburkholderia sp. MPAMCS5 TaxID=3112563 RepID=UPI002E179B66|nr:VOC family protein [Paraburkholderia sp. MPAMCS5]